MSIPNELAAAVLAEHAELVRQLQAELYTHSGESIEQVIRRVEQERPGNPTVAMGLQAFERRMRQVTRQSLLAERSRLDSAA